ncbi:MAG: c-type cytochrome biogenesis protein CcsB [Syntrophorhabdaceae bacterium]|nr:c-type cytochrome biogenesis protein CcsB [Syntrophorhabdaceae bacterium]
MTTHHTILGIATILYLALFFIHVLYFAVGKKAILTVARYGLLAALVIQAAGIALRWVESYRLGIGHAPLSNYYESLIFFSWCVSLFVFVMRKRLYPLITFMAVAASLGLMAYASLAPGVDRGIQPLIPALQSNWLHVHVITCFLAYAAFVVSFICGVLSFFHSRGIVPPGHALEDINYRSIIIGFSMLTSGILTGAVWAHYAWGSYWSWDPKETWSLITWIVYALILHLRFAGGWRGRRIAIVSIIGFTCVVMTYFGVNLFLAGLHSYAI